METYETTVDLVIAGEEAELKAHISYEYDPGQEQIVHPVESSQEGIPASVVIYEVRVEPSSDSELIDIFYLLTEEMLDSLDEDILKHKTVQQEA